MRFGSLMSALIYAGLALQATLVAVLLIKKCWATLPLFTVFATFNFLGAWVIFAVHKDPKLYFYSFWIVECLAVVLGLMVVYEVFQRLLAGYPALHKLAKIIFNVTVVGLALLGGAVIYFQAPHGAARLSDGVLVVQEATRSMEIGLLMFLFLFATIFGLHWRQHEFGIALGLGIFVAIELISVAIKTHVGYVAAEPFGVIRVMAIDSSLLIWLGYILIPERVASQAELPKRAQLEQWNHAMMELISQ